jgi:hypothetical protein
MALYYTLPIYKESYKLVYMLYSLTNNFTRDYKYTIGQEMKDEGVNLIKNLYRANKTKDKTIYLSEARENLELIRLFVRLMQDFNQIGLKSFIDINQGIENISKQLTAWEKYSKNFPSKQNKIKE